MRPDEQLELHEPNQKALQIERVSTVYRNGACGPDVAAWIRLVASETRPVPPEDRFAMGWQKASGYTIRARAEAAIARWKQVVGNGLRSHAHERRATKVGVAVHALNRILGFGHPISVRIA